MRQEKEHGIALAWVGMSPAPPFISCVVLGNCVTNLYFSFLFSKMERT